MLLLIEFIPYVVLSFSPVEYHESATCKIFRRRAQRRWVSQWNTMVEEPRHLDLFISLE
jgi:hypothetical protein